MPESYRLRVKFTRMEGVHSIGVFFRGPNGMGTVDIDGWGEGLSGVQALDGKDLRSRYAFDHRLENGKPCELELYVSGTHVKVFIDGKNRYTSPITGRLSIVYPWAWEPGPEPDLAIGSYQSSILFSSIEWRPYDP